MSWESEIVLHQDSLTPLYQQLQEGLKTWIQSGLRDGSLSPGECIPSENDLVRKLNVSTTTVKRALEELQRQGFIKRIQGRGSYITGQRKFEGDLRMLFSLSNLAQSLDMKSVRRKIELVEIPAPAGIASHLKIPTGARIARLIRARLFDRTPFAMDTSYIPLSLFPDLINVYDDETGLYKLLEIRYRNAPLWAQDFIEPVLITQEEANILGVPVGTAGLLIEHTAFGKDDIPIEFNKSVLRGDLCRFSIILRSEEL